MSRWTNEYDVPVSTDPDYRVHVVNDTLVLHNVIHADTGNYSCHVTNMAATRSRTVSVVVSSKLLKQFYDNCTPVMKLF